ncbi:MAG: hypothetical protein SGILL_006730, partial [Bacillariaceae sp.]
DDDLGDSLLFVDRDEDDDDDDDDAHREQHHLGLPPPPPPPPVMSAAAGRNRLHNNPYAAPHSPGNTSLSSWDTSPHVTNRVHVHFSPPRNSDTESRGSSRRAIPPPQMQQQQQQQTNTNIESPMESKSPKQFLAITGNNGGPDTQQEQHFSSNSTSPASEGRMQQLEAFLDDLRVNSEGKVQDSSALDSNTSFESALFQGSSTIQDVLRQPVLPQNVAEHEQQTSQQRHSRLSSVDTAVAQNTFNPGSLDLPVTSPTTNRDDHTLNMVLSDSGDEQDDDGNRDNAKQEATTIPSGSADAQDEDRSGSPPILRSKSVDETTPKSKQRTPERKGFLERAGFLRRKARKNKSSPPKSSDDGLNTEGDGIQPAIPAKNAKPAHRRQRSGDAAAAALSTGSDQWKGMKLDRIPVPESGVDGDETDTTSDTKKKSSNSGSRKVGSGTNLFNKRC